MANGAGAAAGQAAQQAGSGLLETFLQERRLKQRESEFGREFGLAERRFGLEAAGTARQLSEERRRKRWRKAFAEALTRFLGRGAQRGGQQQASAGQQGASPGNQDRTIPPSQLGRPSLQTAAQGGL